MNVSLVLDYTDVVTKVRTTSVASPLEMPNILRFDWQRSDNLRNNIP